MIRPAALRALLDDGRGTMAIETALVAPLLGIMALGAFDASRMIAREQHLQSAANEGTEIILAAAADPAFQASDLKAVLESSLGLEGNVEVVPQYRCGTSDIVSEELPTCAAGEQLYTYVKLTVNDSYAPVWTQFGIDHAVDFNIERTVQIR